MSDLNRFEHLKIELDAIKLTTNDFAEDKCIGKGGFGKVYEGKLKHSTGAVAHVALKRLILDPKIGQGNREFRNELLILSLYKHENIVSLLGFCDDGGEKILAYKYASKKGLDLHLGSNDLTWVQRLKICIGAARGLACLHDPAGTQQIVSHRDIKSSNILLDGNWEALIADLGLSRFIPANQQLTFIFSNACGTIGYIDPLYVETELLTKESDVYSFGVVLFEVLCGMLCFVYKDKSKSFTEWVRKSYKQRNLDGIVYSSIKDEINPSSLQEFAEIAYKCLKRDREERPSMSTIVRKLETALEQQSPSLSRLNSNTELDDQRNAMTKEFAEFISEERSSRAQQGHGKLKSEAVPLINADRSSNCEITLQKIRVPLPDIINAIFTLDSSALNVDQVKDLIGICPTMDEMLLLKNHEGNKKMLGQCEQFILECARIPRIAQKLRVFAFKFTFSSRVNKLQDTLNTIVAATKEIRESAKLVVILQTIARMGNLLNAGTSQGSADRSKLQSLEKLGDTLTTNKKITLWHYLCKVVTEQTPESLDFDKDLPHLEAASMIHITSSQLDMFALVEDLKEVQQEFDASANDGDVSARFREVSKSFLDWAGVQLQSLTSFSNGVVQYAGSLVQYFAEDPNDCSWEQVISSLVRFIAAFKKAHSQNNKQWAERGKQQLLESVDIVGNTSISLKQGA